MHPENMRGPSKTGMGLITGFAPGGLGWGSEKALARGLPGQRTSTAAACLSPSVEQKQRSRLAR